MAEIFVENEPILNKFLNKIKSTKKNVQAYILYGNSKEKLREYAILLSKFLICPHNYKENCNQCNICFRIDRNSFSELIVINPVNNVIKKEDVLKLRSTFSTNAIEGKNQVYIINDAELLNKAASNSILKFLEEPDSNSVAIFTTTNLDLVINTIVSRCQIIKINNVNEKKGMELIRKISGFEDETIYNIIDYVKEIEKSPALAMADLKPKFLDVFTSKEDAISAINVMILYYKDILNYKINQKSIYFDKNDVKILADKKTKDDISKKISFLLENIKKLEYNVNMLLFMDNLIIGIGEIENDKSNWN